MAQSDEWSPPGATGLSSEYRADIDGLRAIAILSVILFHAGFSSFHGGFTGVDIFFVISGYLIGGHIYSDERSGRFRFRAFYSRRAKRILPALYVVITTTLCLGLVLLSPRELQRAATEGVATLLSGSNFFYWKVTDYFAVASEQRTLLMTWSLGLEEQFYLLVPLLMVWVLRAKMNLAIVLTGLSLLSFGVACYQVAHSPVSGFYLLPGRSWELLTGVLFALVATSTRRVTPQSVRTQHVLGGLGLVLALLPVFLLTTALPFPALRAVPSVLGSALILQSPLAWTNTTILSTRGLRFVGRISYSLYLWHWPLLTLTRVVLGVSPLRVEATIVLVISTILAIATYYWVEQPFRASRTSETRLLLRYVTATIVLLIACFGIRATYGLAFRAPALATEERLDTIPDDPCLVQSATVPNPHSPCAEDTGRPRVVLWGDSHAGSLAPVLRQMAHQSGYDFIEATKGSCPPLANAGRYFSKDPGFAGDCINFNNVVLHNLETDHHVQLIILAAYWKVILVDPYKNKSGWIVRADRPDTDTPSLDTSQQLFSDALALTIAKLQQSGKRVFVVQDVPGFSVEPLWHSQTTSLSVRRWLIGKLRPGQQIDTGRDTKMDQMEDEMARTIVANVVRAKAADLIDPEGELCVSVSTCSYRDAHHTFYQDNQHVTRAGAEAVLCRFSLPISTTY
jgi:peptidoglycan/LPS O-acetylase OafA/YrhL